MKNSVSQQSIVGCGKCISLLKNSQTDTFISLCQHV